MIRSPSLQSPVVPVPSSLRPIPLRRRLDLRIQRINFRGAFWWVVKDPLGLKYHRLPAEQYHVLELLDGKRSLKGVRDELSKRFPERSYQLAEVQQIVTSLHQIGLLWNDRYGQSAALLTQQKLLCRRNLRQTLGNVLSIRLPGWNPDAVLRWMDGRLGWVFHPISLAMFGVLVALTWVLVGVHVDQIRDRLPEFRQFFGWQNLLWLWLTLGATKFLHELGHGLACRHFGSECHEMGVMVMVFIPTLYCDVTDSWMLRDKWKRIAIAAAGIGVEVVLSALAILGWWFTNPGLLNHLCLNVFFVTTVTTVVFNANPLMRYDGYYMLSDWLGVPNLRERSSAVLRDIMARCFGIAPVRDPLVLDCNIWFAGYAVASTLYGWMVLLTVLLFVYGTLKPYGLQNVSIVFAVLSVAGIVAGIAVNTYRVMAAPKTEPIKLPRTILMLSLLLAIAISFVMVPLPFSIQSPCIVEPLHAINILTPATGELIEFSVHPGEIVHQGQLLAILRDPDREDALQELRVARQTQLAESSTLHALDQVADHAVAVQQLESFDRQIEELESQLQALTIFAPNSGRIVAAPSIQEPPRGSRRRLGDWHGNVGDPNNLGGLLMARTHLLSIAPDDSVEIVLYLDQAHRDDVEVNQKVHVVFEHQPARVYTALVTGIAKEHSEIIPPTLSSKGGGTVPSVTDAAGHERLTSIAYRVQVVLHGDTGLIRPGMRGIARFRTQGRTAAAWTYRILSRTVQFRL